ncbi:hypothetical protein EJD97_006355 [Solanum chilense]|uniref:Uncharacterized protein n=1 Tax=Solanum chilense TaxID=4083 RepID=A0A6N2BT48_SOLCI|nr:hypothetical protein EJD97_006355 [Solanum chilense]
MAMNTPLQDLPYIQKSTNFTIILSQNREVEVEGIVSASPESTSYIRSTSSRIYKDSTTGVCSSNDEANNTHIISIFNQFKGEINNKNNSTASIDPNSKLQQEGQESEGEASVSNRKAKQNTNIEVSQSIEATTIGKEYKIQ